MDPQTLRLYGGVAGGVIGVLDRVAGTAAGIADTSGPHERAFAGRYAALTLVALTLALTATLLLPGPVRSLAVLPMFLAMPRAIRASNRRREELKREGAAGHTPDAGRP